MCVSEPLEPGRELATQAHLLVPSAPHELNLVRQLALDLHDPSRLISRELPPALRVERGGRNVDAPVGLDQRRQPGQAAARDQHVQVVVRPVVQREVRRGVVARVGPLRPTLRSGRSTLSRGSGRSRRHDLRRCETERGADSLVRVGSGDSGRHGSVL